MELTLINEVYINVRVIPSTSPTLSPVTTPPSTHYRYYIRRVPKELYNALPFHLVAHTASKL